VIGRLQGRLAAKTPPQVMVDVAGVGYELDVPMSTFYNLPRTGEPVELLTHFVVREDAQLLFGFLTAAERTAFRQLLKVNGVGPKVALSVLSGLSVDDLAAAVASNDAARLTKVPGVGKKTAERVVLELKEKLGLEQIGPEGTVDFVARDALLELGYTIVEADRAPATTDPEAPPEERVRQALRAA